MQSADGLGSPLGTAQLLRVVAEELTSLYKHSTCGAVHLDQLGKLDKLRALVAKALGSEDPGVEDPAVLLSVLVALDRFAQGESIKEKKVARKKQNSRGTMSHDIVQAVGEMLLIEDRVEPGLVKRRERAGKKVGTQGREMHDDNSQARNKLPLYRRSYVGYLWKTLNDPEIRALILGAPVRLPLRREFSPVCEDIAREGEQVDEVTDTSASLLSGEWVIAARFGRSADDGPPIIQRPQEIAEIESWISGKQRVLLLAGDSGNGKSTLAMQTLAASKYASTVYYIDAGNILSLQMTLGKYLPEGPVPDVKKAIDSFVRTLSRADARSIDSIVFLDNVSDFSEVEPIVVWASRTLITAEERIVPTDFIHPFSVIDVEPMPLSSAQQLISWFRPEESAEAVCRFASSVGRKPRIIMDCLAMFPNDNTSLDEMSDLIANEESRLIQRKGESNRRAVHKLYERYFIRLESEDVIASLLLASIAHLSTDYVPTEVCGETLSRYGTLFPEFGDLSKFAVKAVAEPLHRRYLITRDLKNIRIHGVTAQLFRDVTRANRRDIVHSFIEAYFEFRQSIATARFGRLHPELINWAPTICTVLKQFPVAILETIERNRLDQLVGDVRVGMAYLGRFEDYIEMVYTHNGIAIGYLEYKAMLKACFHFGKISRQEYLDKLRGLVQRDKRVADDPEVLLAVAEVSYKIREILVEWPVPIPELKSVLQTDIVNVVKLGLALTFSRSLNWVGVGGIMTPQLLSAIDRESLGSFPIYAAGMARHAVEFYGLQGNHEVAKDWHFFMERVQEAPDLADSFGREADSAEGQAWILRSTLSDVDSARQVSDAFVTAAQKHVRAGGRRHAVALYTEAYLIDVVFEVRKADDSERSSLRQLLDSLDEPHLQCRIAILEEMALQLKSDYVFNLKSLADLTLQAWEAYQDARGRRLGLAAQIAVLRRRSSRKGELRNLLSELAGLVMPHKGFSTNDDALQWLRAVSADPRFMSLM
ncbi:ATP-binding protein [Nocardia asteroides]|uniref:ATP-binding protein n=1 Tax=Nocardia asteroides TaxID=1824 RepID=UPI001E445489|nr:ATP-binding protein [Nocardia asteroides]UGT62869.1 ATP-binding protein [Nocardia asteroides]